MPPKSTKSLPITLKFKRQAQTIFVSVLPKETVNDLKLSLLKAINSTGGIKINNKPTKLNDESYDSDQDEDIELDISIPKPSFDTSDDDDEDNEIAVADDAETTKETVVGGGSGDSSQKFATITDITELKFALASDKLNPYDANEYTEFDFKDSQKIENLNFSDNDVVVFALADEPFNVFKPEPDAN